MNAILLHAALPRVDSMVTRLEGVARTHEVEWVAAGAVVLMTVPYRSGAPSAGLARRLIGTYETVGPQVRNAILHAIPVVRGDGMPAMLEWLGSLMERRTEELSFSWEAEQAVLAAWNSGADGRALVEELLAQGRIGDRSASLRARVMREGGG
jgi:hypothetical protein